MDCKEIFINGLSAYMERMHFSRIDIANIIGRSVQNVSQILKGKNGITYENLFKLFDAGMRLEEAFGEEMAGVIRSGEPDAVVEGERMNPAQIILAGISQLRKEHPDNPDLEALIRSIK